MLQNLLSKLRNHIGVVTFMGIALLMVVIFLSVNGCVPKTASPLDPTKQVSGVELVAQVGTQQATFDARSADIESDIKKYNSDVAAYNASVATAKDQLAAKSDIESKVISTVGGLVTMIASGGHIDGSQIAGSLFTLLLGAGAVGAVTDSSKKSAVINNLRATNSASSNGTDAANVSPALKAA